MSEPTDDADRRIVERATEALQIAIREAIENATTVEVILKIDFKDGIARDYTCSRLSEFNMETDNR